MDGRQFNRIIDVSCELSGARPCGHRFGGAVPKAAPQRAAICDLKMEPVQGPARLIRQLIGDSNRFTEMCDCLGICRALQRLLARLAPPLQRYLAQSRFGEVVCHDFRLCFGDDWKLIAQDVANVLMEQMPAALEQTLVSRFLNQRMLEAIDRFRRRPAAQQQFGLFELSQRGAQRQIIAPRNTSQQRV